MFFRHIPCTPVLLNSARTSGNWFVVSAMGREAGHLAFGIGADRMQKMDNVKKCFMWFRFNVYSIENYNKSDLL